MNYGSCPCSLDVGAWIYDSRGILYVIVSLYLLKVRGFKRLLMNIGFVYRGIVFERSLRMIY